MYQNYKLQTQLSVSKNTMSVDIPYQIVLDHSQGKKYLRMKQNLIVTKFVKKIYDGICKYSIMYTYM